MSDFVNDWIRCNICFKGFEKNGGILTSCGHFFCNRPDCQIQTKDGKATCPICKSQCGTISLSDSLPPEILQFFEEPEHLLQKTMNVLRFHNNQKELLRNHFSKSSNTIRELEAKIEELKEENYHLMEELQKQSGSRSKAECLIPGIINQNNTKKKSKNTEFFKIKPNAEGESKKQNTPKHPKSSHSQKDPPISKLFTPTLASRIQNLTGKKIYDPV